MEEKVINKSTKAPWAWQKFGNKYCLTAQHGMREIILGANPVDGENGFAPCMVVMNEDGILRPIDPDHPNAKLIASAPELLEALHWAKGIGKNGEVHDKIVMDRINMVIKKATGEEL